MERRIRDSITEYLVQLSKSNSNLVPGVPYFTTGGSLVLSFDYVDFYNTRSLLHVLKRVEPSVTGVTTHAKAMAGTGVYLRLEIHVDFRRRGWTCRMYATAACVMACLLVPFLVVHQR